MNRIERIKKTSKSICRISKTCQTIFTIISALCLIAAVIIFFMRNLINEMPVQDNARFDYSNMGYVANKFADEGKIVEAFAVFGLSMALYAALLTVIMYSITKIFKRFCREYSPFLAEEVKDIKITAILVTLLIFLSSIGLGIILGFVLYGIIQIYEYGCELQNQSDETL